MLIKIVTIKYAKFKFIQKLLFQPKDYFFLISVLVRSNFEEKNEELKKYTRIKYPSFFKVGQKIVIKQH